MFIPDKECARPDLIASTGDFLRIWQIKEDKVQLLKLLNNVRLQSLTLPPHIRRLYCMQHAEACNDILSNHDVQYIVAQTMRVKLIV